MFFQLKGVVDLVRGGIAHFRKFKSKRERESALVDILKFYFLLKDCVDEGEQLIDEAGSDPVAKINAMSRNDAAFTVKRWDLALRRQGVRLRVLQGYIFGLHPLSVINPKLQEELSEVVGNKMQRAVTLYGIGATLFIRTIIPDEDTDDEKARLVARMAGASSTGTLNIRRVRREIASLRRSLDEFRSVVARLVSDEELTRLSCRAREETLFGSGPDPTLPLSNK